MPTPPAHLRSLRCIPLQALLKDMQPTYKLVVITRLTDEVLAAAAEGSLPLRACEAVIGDALELLNAPAMQIVSKKTLAAAVEDNLDEGGSQARAVLLRRAARACVFGCAMKQCVEETKIWCLSRL